MFWCWRGSVQWVFKTFLAENSSLPPLRCQNPLSPEVEQTNRVIILCGFATVSFTLKNAFKWLQVHMHNMYGSSPHWQSVLCLAFAFGFTAFTWWDKKGTPQLHNPRAKSGLLWWNALSFPLPLLLHLFFISYTHTWPNEHITDSGSGGIPKWPQAKKLISLKMSSPSLAWAFGRVIFWIPHARTHGSLSFTHLHQAREARPSLAEC